MIIGGVAANVHGSDRLTLDLDGGLCPRSGEFGRCYSRHCTTQTATTYTRRSRPIRLGFAEPEKRLSLHSHTEAGDIDLLGDAPGVGPFNRVWDEADEVDLFGMTVRVATVDDLIAMKRFANRGKDNPHLFDLEAIRNLRQGSPASDSVAN